MLNLKTRIMKKTLLISTAFFLSVTSFAQTTATNSEAVKGQTNIEHNKAGTQLNSSENASSATTIHTGVVENAKNRSTEQIKEDNKATAAEKQALAAQAKDKGQATAAAAKTKASSTLEDNKADDNSSLSGSKTLSESADANQIGKLKSAEKENVHATLKGDNRSQVAVDKTAAVAQDKIDAATKLDDNSSVSDDETVSGTIDNEAGKLKSAEKENVHATLKGDNRSQVAVDKTAAVAQDKIDAATKLDDNSSVSDDETVSGTIDNEAGKLKST